MDSVNRIVIHDRPPMLVRSVYQGWGNRAVIAAALVSFAVQILAVAQVVAGRGETVPPFDHVDFALVSFLWLLLGVFVFLQRQGRPAGRYFLLSASAGSIFLCLVTLARVSMAFSLLYVAGLLFFPPLLLAFVREFSGHRVSGRYLLLLCLPPAALLWPTASAVFLDQRSLLWRLGIASVAAYLAAAIFLAYLDVARKPAADHAAEQRALLFGLTAGTVPGALVFVVPFVTGGQSLVALGWLPPLVLIFLLSMSYAVLLFELVEADLIVRRGVVYGVLTLAVVVAYGFLGFVLAASRASVTSPGGGLSFVAVTILVGAGFTPLRRAARRMVDWLLYGRRSDRWELLQELSGRLAAVMQPDDLEQVLVSGIVEALHLRGGFLLTRNEDDAYYVSHPVGAEGNLDRVPARGMSVGRHAVDDALGSPPHSLLLVHARPLTASRHEDVPNRYRALDALRVALAMPLVSRSGLHRVLCLQGKLAHDAFDADDLDLLGPIMRQASVAFDNALLFARLEDKITEVRNAYIRIAREQEAERARLARELHDGTAQELASLMTLAAVAERQMGRDEGAVASTLERLRKQAEDAYQGVRRASHALRPLMLDDFGLATTLESYFDGFQERTHIKVVRRVDVPGELDPDVQLALFRVTQECLENVRKHSQATQVEVRLSRSDGHISLGIKDNGVGFSGRSGPGIGIASMRERLEAVGGTMQVRDGMSGGVAVDVEVPISL